MQAAFDTLYQMEAGASWLVLAFGVASLILVASMLHYRRLWIAAKDEHTNSRDLIENLSEGIYRSSLDGRQLSANPALVKLNGYTSETEMLAAVTDIAVEWYVEPERRDEFRRVLHAEGHIEDFVSEIYRHKTREQIWITESARIVKHKRTGRPLYYEGSVREITETVKRLKLEEHYQKLISQVPGGLFQYSRDADGKVRVIYYSEGFLRMTGIADDPNTTDPDTFTRLILPEDIGGYYDSLRQCFRTMTYWDHECRIRTPDGVEKWLRVSAAPEKVGDSVIWHGYVSDISIRKRQEIKIRELAYFDPLTQLPNRRALVDRLAESLDAAKRRRNRGALLFIDLDNFKSLNDTQGHDVGDAYLIQVARRLTGCVQDGDLVARIGGDEFVVSIEDAGANEAAATQRAVNVANRVLSEMSRVHKVGTVEHQASASVGVVVYDGNEPRVDEVLKRADIAMYKAKAAGRNAMAIFDPGSMQRENEQFRLIAEMRTAITEDHFQLHFQPQVDKRGQVIAAEALLRWYHPDHGIIKPDRFIPLAERSGLINDLGRMVLAKSIRTLAEWQSDRDTAHLRMSVNISVKSFASPEFIPHIEALVAEHRIDASRLMLEFTEHVMAENHQATAERMRHLKQLGISFSLDDFGTGYSSLAYLRQLPFDEVKIDGSFVTDIETKESDRALVRTILAMAETLGLSAVAEHVETARQEAFLLSFGCQIFQGYLYAPPLQPSDFVARARMPAPLARTAEIMRRSA